MIPSNPLIRVEELKKSYPARRRASGAAQALLSLARRGRDRISALNGVSFSVERGEVVGYIGPNGAGKSTTIKILCGILHPDSGFCSVKGRIPWKDRKAHVAGIGVVFGQRSQLWWDVPVLDSFELLRDIYRVPRERYASSLDELTQALGLGDMLSMPARSLSLGQRMRCELAASLLHSPDILFLDEPTIGLDAPAKLAVRAFVERANRERGVTVILTTHDAHDIEALAKRVILIGKGEVLYDGAFADLVARPRGGRQGGQASGPEPQAGAALSLEEALAEVYGEMGI
jgi:ABC-2 type transport system ATP-binding protein